MLTSVISMISSLVGCLVSAAVDIVALWPVAVMVAFLIIGFAIGWIRRLAGGKKGGKKGK